MNPIVPRSKADPTGQKVIRDRSIRRTRSMFKLMARKIRAVIDTVPYEVNTVSDENAPKG